MTADEKQNEQLQKWMGYPLLGWTSWTLLMNLDWKKVPTCPGAYAISAGRQIARAVGVDEQGVLHIGESDNLNRRIKKFVNAPECKGMEQVIGHMAGWRYARFNMTKVFSYDRLHISWISSKDKKEAYWEESNALDDYFRKHYELPPLNYKFNWASVPE